MEARRLRRWRRSSADRDPRLDVNLCIRGRRPHRVFLRVEGTGPSGGDRSRFRVLRTLDLPWTDFSSVRARDNRVVFRAGSATAPSRIVSMDLDSGISEIRRASLPERNPPALPDISRRWVGDRVSHQPGPNKATTITAIARNRPFTRFDLTRPPSSEHRPTEGRRRFLLVQGAPEAPGRHRTTFVGASQAAG